ncbi:hypothetical protein BGZ98_005373 [Dissophora globulifera]|nr:hypothetical protein BGZ98_005373 [Dissophora globulifera]
MGDFKACVSVLSALAATAGSPTFGTQDSAITTAGVSTNKADKPIANSNAILARTGINSTQSSSSTASNKNKSNNTGKRNDKNIMIWSEEVADAASATTERSAPKSSGLYKQGQVVGSSTQSSAMPSRVITAAAISTSQKTSFRAMRNPSYMKKHGLEEPAVTIPTPKEEPKELNEQGIDNEEEEEDPAPPPDDFPSIQRPQQQQEKKMTKKGMRKKKAGKAEAFAQARTLASPADGHISNLLGGLSIMDGQLAADDNAEDNNDLVSEQDQGSSSTNNNVGLSDVNVNPQHHHQNLPIEVNMGNIKPEELEFLKSCFPDRDYSDDYLIQVLKAGGKDLEAAIEIILSQMFLESEQVETSSSGSGSFYSSGSHATGSTTTTSSMDDAFFQGVQKSKKNKSGSGDAGGPAWGALHHQAWDGQNDSLLKTLDRQDEFLIPESNEWATFEHQISILMNIFHTVPQKTIVSEYHANGAHLFKTVESLERRLKQENHHGSAEGRKRQSQFDVNLAQLMEMFPEHSVTGLKKMLVYSGGNLQDAMNAVLAADFARADQKDRAPTSKQRGTVIPFNADIRYVDSVNSASASSSGNGGTSNRSRPLPSTSNPFPNGQRPFPNTLLDNANTNLYNNEDDPVWCRERAQEMLEQRNELFRKAAKAYQLSKGKGPGMGGIAAYYADEGKKLDTQGKQWHMRAARAVVQQHRLENKDPNLVDLHGLTISEAQTVVKEAVTEWFSRATMQASRIAAKPLKIVCGVGSHSKDRIARLYPTVLSLLMKDGWRCEAENGVILVKGVARHTPVPSRKR